MKKITTILATLALALAVSPAVFAEEETLLTTGDTVTVTTNCEGDGEAVTNCVPTELTESLTDEPTDDSGITVIEIDAEDDTTTTGEAEAEEETSEWTTGAIIAACAFLVLIVVAVIFGKKED